MMGMLDVMVIGRVGVDFYAEELHTRLKDVRVFRKYLGGCPGNVAVGLARLGVKVALTTRVGDDEWGHFIREFLRDQGVDIGAVRMDPESRTSVAFIEVSPPDKFPVLFYRRDCADYQLSIQDVDSSKIADARLLFTSGTSLASSRSRAAVHYALECARDAGTTVVFDVDYRPSEWEDPITPRVYGLAALRLADIVFCNEEEMAMLVDAPDVSVAISRLMAYGPKIVVLKLGKRGARVFEKDRVISAPSFEVRVVSGLGAGDAFASGFCYGLLRGWDLSRCARFASAAGAIVATRLSCSEAMPYIEEIEEFLASHGYEHLSTGERHIT